MARDRATVTVYRSGSIYLVARGERGELIERRRLGEADLQSILAHSNVQDPWEEVTDRAGLPAHVAQVVAEWERRE